MPREISFYVFTTHSVSREDETPLRMVSEELLTYYQRAEAVAVALAALAVGALFTSIILYVRASDILVI